MSKSRNARWIQRWHRRLGIFSALVLLVLSATGLLLNHSSHLHLGEAKLSRAVASWLYAEQVPPSQGSYLPQGWVYQLEQNILLNNENIQRCESAFLGALWLESVLYIACEQQLHVLDKEMRLIESLDSRLGYPAPVTLIANCGSLCLQSKGGNWRYQFNAGTFNKTEEQKNWHALKKLPHQISASAPSAFSWERLILDIHAGRFLGPAGVWIMDFFVVVFFILSFSGIYLWWRKNAANKKTKNR